MTDTKRKDLAMGLTGLLADTYVLYNTTQFHHWNVEGSGFRTLHGMFEEQYRELAEAVDLLAERIRVLGYYTPGTLVEFTRNSRLTQEENIREARTMLKQLILGHQQVVHRIRDLIPAAGEATDEATEDLLVERLRVHEKTLWMLRSQADLKSEKIPAETLRRVS